MTDPVVRVHVLDPATGSYMRNLAVPGMVLDPMSQAYVSGRGVVAGSIGEKCEWEGGGGRVLARDEAAV